MDDIRYFLVYSEDNEQDYIKAFGHNPNLSSFYLLDTNNHNDYSIRTVNFIKVGRMSLSAYAKTIDEELEIEITAKEAEKFSGSELYLMMQSKTPGMYVSIDAPITDYKILPREFRYYIDRDAYQTVAISKNENGYTIKNVVEELEIKLGILDRSFKEIDFNCGIYISVDSKKIKEDFKKYLIRYNRNDKEAFTLTSSHVYLLPVDYPQSLSIIERYDYSLLTKDCKMVSLVKTDDGEVKIRYIKTPEEIDGNTYYLLDDVKHAFLNSATVRANVAYAITRFDYGDDTYKKENVK